MTKMADDELTRKDAEMLTREEIERWRKICLSHWIAADSGDYLSREESIRQSNALCDLALRALSLESVREEALPLTDVLDEYDEISNSLVGHPDGKNADFVITNSAYRVLRQHAVNAEKFKWQVRDTCVRAEKAEHALQHAPESARSEALEEAAKACDAHKDELVREARAAPSGFALVGYRQLTAEYLAAAIRALQKKEKHDNGRYSAVLGQDRQS